MLERNRIVCADAAQWLQTLPEACIDMALTSPPYDSLRTYNGYVFDFEAIAAGLYRCLKPGGVLVWIVGDATIDGCETLTSMRQALHFVDVAGFNMHDTMIYEVAGTGAKGSHRSYWQAFEYMFVLSKGAIKTVHRLADVKNLRAGSNRGPGAKTVSVGTRLGWYQVREFGIRTNVWRYHAGNNGDDQTEHPAPFPEKLARDHIVSWSNAGDLVLDPFMGSGTTAIVARRLGRDYIGCDISPEYVALAEKRLAKPYTKQMFLD